LKDLRALSVAEQVKRNSRTVKDILQPPFSKVYGEIKLVNCKSFADQHIQNLPPALVAGLFQDLKSSVRE